MQIIFPQEALSLHQAAHTLTALMPAFVHSGLPIDSSDPIIGQILEDTSDLPREASAFLQALREGKNEDALRLGEKTLADWKKKIPDVLKIEIGGLASLREINKACDDVVRSPQIPLDVRYKLVIDCRQIKDLDLGQAVQCLENTFQFDPRLEEVLFKIPKTLLNPLGKHLVRNPNARSEYPAPPLPGSRQYLRFSTDPLKFHHTLRMRFMGAMLAGIAGDALGVPVEIVVPRADLRKNPVTGMQGCIRGYGQFRLPPGTWSDDTSMELGGLDAFTTAGADPRYYALAFVRWLLGGAYSATGDLFSFGISTQHALLKLMDGTPPTESGDTGEEYNGNGALMRIAHLIFNGIFAHNVYYTADAYLKTLSDQIDLIVGITHLHPRSRLGCLIFGILGRHLLEGYPLPLVLNQTNRFLKKKTESDPSLHNEWPHYAPLFDPSFKNRPEEAIQSGVYVVDTLLASVWCLLNTDNLESAVLKAVNLGGDADTTAKVTGVLAGIIYGYEAIPKAWIDALQKKREILVLLQRFCRSQLTPTD